MEKYKIIIEEHISKEFEVEANSPEEAEAIAEANYASGEWVVDSESVNAKLMAIAEPGTDDYSEFFEF